VLGHQHQRVQQILVLVKSHLNTAAIARRMDSREQHAIAFNRLFLRIVFVFIATSMVNSDPSIHRQGD